MLIPKSSVFSSVFLQEVSRINAVVHTKVDGKWTIQKKMGAMSKVSPLKSPRKIMKFPLDIPVSEPKKPPIDFSPLNLISSAHPPFGRISVMGGWLSTGPRWTAAWALQRRAPPALFGQSWDGFFGWSNGLKEHVAGDHGF